MGARAQCPGALQRRNKLLTCIIGQHETFNYFRSTLFYGPRIIINSTPLSKVSQIFLFTILAPKEVGMYGNILSSDSSIFNPQKSMWLHFNVATTQKLVNGENAEMKYSNVESKLEPFTCLVS